MNTQSPTSDFCSLYGVRMTTDRYEEEGNTVTSVL